MGEELKLNEGVILMQLRGATIEYHLVRNGVKAQRVGIIKIEFDVDTQLPKGFFIHDAFVIEGGVQGTTCQWDLGLPRLRDVVVHQDQGVARFHLNISLLW